MGGRTGAGKGYYDGETLSNTGLVRGVVVSISTPIENVDFIRGISLSSYSERGKGGKELSDHLDTVFQIAGIGIVVAMIHTILRQMGKEDFAHWVTLVGFGVVLFMVAVLIQELFQTIKNVFLFRP